MTGLEPASPCFDGVMPALQIQNAHFLCIIKSSNHHFIWHIITVETVAPLLSSHLYQMVL